MANFDDVLFSPEQDEKEQTPPAQFDPDAFKERKQQERDDVYARIDTAATELTSPEKLKEYLDIQARFDLYRPGNVLLIQSQMPTASRLKSYDDWLAVGAGVKKGAKHIDILKSGKQFVRDDGSIGQYTNVVQVFDISQTFNAKPPRTPQHPEGRALLKALMNKSPVPAKAADNLPDGLGAYYDPQTKAIYVMPGMDAPDIFRCISAELAHAEIHRSMGEGYSRDNANLAAYCAAYVLCREYGVDVSDFTFENTAKVFEGKEAKDIRGEMGLVREAAGEIGTRMKTALQLDRKAKEPQEAEQEAR
jgi:hypothetical protein